MASAGDETREMLRDEVERLEAQLRRNPYWAAWADLDRLVGEGRGPRADVVARLVGDYVENLCADPVYVAYLSARARLRALPEPGRVSPETAAATFAILEEQARALPRLDPPPTRVTTRQSAKPPERRAGRTTKAALATADDAPLRPAPPFTPTKPTAGAAPVPAEESARDAAGARAGTRQPRSPMQNSLLDRLSEIEREADALDAQTASEPPPPAPPVPVRPTAVPLVVEEAEVVILADDDDDNADPDATQNGAPISLIARLDQLADIMPEPNAAPRRRSAARVAPEDEADVEIVVEDEGEEPQR